MNIAKFLRLNLPDYEERPQQIEMAGKIKECLDQHKHLIVEAGTGIGKSMAYLLPSIHWAIKNKTKVLISTNTRALQMQLVEKDLPFLKQKLQNFKFVVCYGSENYLCKRRLDLLSGIGFLSKKENDDYILILGWNKITKTGEISELSDISSSIWKQVCREVDLCLKQKCEYYKSDCFYYKARRRYNDADILVANHHLFFANISSGRNALPPFSAIVFDEAHWIEDVATDYLAIEVSSRQIEFQTDLVKKRYADKSDGLLKVITEVQSSSEKFFDELQKISAGEKKLRIKKRLELDNLLEVPVNNLISLLKIIEKNLMDEDDKIEVNYFINIFLSTLKNLNIFISQELKDYVYWIESGRHNISIKMVPINISNIIYQEVFDYYDVVILTSATLSSNNNFEYIKSRLGVSNAEELLLKSPFDYQKQTLLFIDRTVPPPRAADYVEKLSASIEKLLNLSSGRAFVLFTNYKVMLEVHNKIKERVKFPILIGQGNVKFRLIEKFKNTSGCVLFGNLTFWQGIDVPGDALKLVIITHLPFSVPDEPVISARIEYLESHGKNSFYEYQLPRAAILLKQGFGRLIRCATDSGIVAILDSRIVTKSYGVYFKRSLPECKQIENWNELNSHYIIPYFL